MVDCHHNKDSLMVDQLLDCVLSTNEHRQYPQLVTVKQFHEEYWYVVN